MQETLATVSPSNATDKGITWRSSDTSVATVDDAGNVMAKSGGTTTITVRTNDGGYTSTCTVTVRVPVTGVTLDKTSMTININDSEYLVAMVSPSNATDKSLIWTNSNTFLATATVRSPGNLLNLKAKVTFGGTTTITVKTKDGGYTASCTVTIKVPVIDVTLNKTNTILNVNSTETLVAKVSLFATDKTVTWESNNSSVATVDSSGKVTAIAVGTAIITAKSNDGGYTATCYVLVVDPSNTLTIPSGTMMIDEEAFAGIKAKWVKLPETIQTIGTLSFADCPNLIAIYIPDRCRSIAEDAFSGVTNLTIIGTGSYIKSYASRHGFDFVAVTGN